MVKSKRIIWVGQLARMEERRGVNKVLVGRPEKRDHLENLGIDGSILR
jgi:hypothetical protein